MNTFCHSVISLDNLDSDLYFTPLFEWRDEKIILISYSREAFECNLLKKSIEKISKKTFSQEYSELFAYWTISIEYQLFYFFSKQHVLIVDNESNNVLIVDSKGTVKKTIPCSNLDFHDIVFFNHIICFISEAVIQLINIENDKKIVIDPEKKHDFFRARFLESDDFFKLVILSGNNQKLGSDSILTTYQIDLCNPNH